MDGSTARLMYKAGAAADVARLVRDEGACCGFLGFSMAPVGDGIELRVSAPPEAAGDLRMLLAQLLPSKE